MLYAGDEKVTANIRIHCPLLEATEPVIFVRIYECLTKRGGMECIDNLKKLLNIDYEILSEYVKQGRVCHGEGGWCGGRCLGRLGLWESGWWISVTGRYDGLLSKEWQPQMFNLLYQRVPHFKAICWILSRGGYVKKIGNSYEFEIPRRKFKPSLNVNCWEMYKKICREIKNCYHNAELSTIYNHRRLIDLLIEWLRGLNLLEKMEVRAAYRFDLRRHSSYVKGEIEGC